MFRTGRVRIRREAVYRNWNTVPYQTYTQRASGALPDRTTKDVLEEKPLLPGDRQSLITQLESCIRNNQVPALVLLLREDFIYELLKTCEQESARELNNGCDEIFYLDTYQYYRIKKNIEVLIQDCNADFRRLLALAKEIDANNGSTQLYDNLLVLNNLILENADLSRLDLRRATFINSSLKKANFRNSSLDAANFTQADLKEANLTLEQLDAARCTERAILPADFWTWWTDTTKQNVVVALEALKTYGNELKTKGASGIQKGEALILHADKLLADINLPGAKYNESFQRKFLKDLHSQDPLFAKDRNYKRLIANVLLCVFSGIVPYLIAGAINYKLTGHFTFFHLEKTHSRELIDQVDRAVPHKLSTMEVFLSGAHSRLGEHSTVRTFFGQNKGKPVHPLGDLNVLPLINGFLH